MSERLHLTLSTWIILAAWIASVSSFSPTLQTCCTKRIIATNHHRIKETNNLSSTAGHQLHNIFSLSMSENSNEETAINTTTPKPTVKCPNCDKCDGSGRILGGIPTILPWWPIKPYRPCPNFIANGGQYSRIGQPLDEIAFGRASVDAEDDDF